MGLGQEALGRKLFVATRDGSSSEVKSLLALGACPRYYTHDGQTALMIAASRGLSEACEALLEKSDPTWVDVFGRSALMMAARKGHVECVKALAGRSRINDVDCDGWSALMYASIHGSLDCAALLARLGAQDSPDNSGQTALVKAVCSRNAEMALLLVSFLRLDAADEKALPGGASWSSMQRVASCENTARSVGDVEVADAIAARIEQARLAESIPTKERAFKRARL